MFSRFVSLFSDLPMFLLRIPVILIALCVHECCHALAADKLGDHTARAFGRVTLNPLKHLDPLGAIAMLLCGVGWAKPVPVNSRNFKKPRRDMALTALAGPLSNLCLGFLGCIIYCVLYLIYTKAGLIQSGYITADGNFASSVVYYSVQFALMFVSLNVSLAVFNMLPIPPFDGSRLFGLLLPAKWYYAIMRYEQYIYIGMLLLLVLGSNLISVPLGYVTNGIINGMFWLLERLPFFRV